MDYIYNVEVTAFTGYFTRKEVGKASFKEVRFSNPVQKGDWILSEKGWGHYNRLKEMDEMDIPY